jgi:hypothetical protein
MKDKYAQIAVIKAEETAPNTLSFVELDMGYGLLDKKAIVINRIEYAPTTTVWAEFAATTDSLQIALTTSRTISSLLETFAAVLDKYKICMNANAPLELVRDPFIKDLSQLPGGGILCLPKPLYAGIIATGFAASAVCYVKLFYTVLDLSKEKDVWMELVEMTRLLT